MVLKNFCSAFYHKLDIVLTRLHFVERSTQMIEEHLTKEYLYFTGVQRSSFLSYHHFIDYELVCMHT